MSFFEAPAYKLDIKDVSNAQEQNGEWTLLLTSEDLTTSLRPGTGASTNSATVDKLLPSKEAKLKLSMIWVQGSVVDFVTHEDGSPPFLHIQDSTGEAMISDYKDLPGGDHPQLVKGAYVGVIGQIWTNKPTIVVKGAKIMCLEDKPLLKTMWPDEVVMAKSFLMRLIEPDLNAVN